MFYKKSLEEREQEKLQKQQTMINLEKDYGNFLSKLVNTKKDNILKKNSGAKTLFEAWIYGVYLSILDNQIVKENKGKLYFIFENIPEKNNKYKINYSINSDGQCLFNMNDLKELPKSYLLILKRHNLNLTEEICSVDKLIASHKYKLDGQEFLYHSDSNKLNNCFDNIIPLDKNEYDELTNNKDKAIAKAVKYIPEKYVVEFNKKTKDIIKLEYRACDLYFNHKIPVGKIAFTLRNRLKKSDIERTIRLYSYFKTYSNQLNENHD